MQLPLPRIQAPKVLLELFLAPIGPTLNL